jgi:outer membrane receptor protein involved in Fe transport
MNQSRFARTAATALAVMFAMLATFPNPVLAAGSAQYVGTGAVKGTVTSAEGTPIPGAVVTVSGNGPERKVPTGTEGGYVFSGLPAGTYLVSSSARGYEGLSGHTISVKDGQVTQVDLSMARSASSLVTIGQVQANGSSTISTSSAPTTTLNSQTFAAHGYTYMSDVLQNDISTTLSRPLGGSSLLPTPVSLRGPDPTETLVDIDGFQVNSGNTGDFDLSLLDPSDFSTVEIVKGISPSSLVGPDTIDGALNIRTLEPTTKPQAMMRFWSGSFGAFGETLQATGTDQHFGYALSLHRTTSNGPVNQSVVNAATGGVETVGSTLTASTGLGKLRYTFGNGDGYLQFSVRDQSQFRDLSAALSSIPGAGGSSGDSVGRRPRDEGDDAPPPFTVVNSFAGTALMATNAGYGLDGHIPLSSPIGGAGANTFAQVRLYSSIVNQSVVGPGQATSPYLYNNRDLINDGSIEIDHLFPSGQLAFQYGIRSEMLNSQFLPGVVNEESVGRRPLDSSGPSPTPEATPTYINLGQTQRTAALRYTGDISSSLHFAAAAYYSNYSTFGSSFDPRLGLTWTPDANSVVRASVGSTFQAPQLPELIPPPSPLPPPVGGYIHVGNPNLKPDSATEYSLGYERLLGGPGARTSLSADLYYVSLRTPAATYLPPPVPSCESSSGGDAFGLRPRDDEPVTCPLSYPVNAGDAVYQGLELQGTHQFGRFTTLRAGWAVRSAYLTNVPPSVQDGTLVVGEQSLGLPLQKATLFVDHTPPLGFVYGAGLIYEGPYNELNQGPFTLLNANLGYRFKHFEIGLSGTNLTNVYSQAFTRQGAGVPYGGLFGPISTDAFYLQPAAINLTLTQRF